MMPPTSPISPPSADLVRRLGRIDQFGPKRQASLQEAFKTEAELCKATEKDLRSVAKIGPGLAKVLYGVIATGEFPPSKWRGEARVAMWNTRTQKKVSTRSLPTEEGAEAWLEKRPHCERYTGQDMTLRGPNLVSDASVMGEADYLMHCGQAGSAEELARLDQTCAAIPPLPCPPAVPR